MPSFHPNHLTDTCTAPSTSALFSGCRSSPHLHSSNYRAVCPIHLRENSKSCTAHVRHYRKKSNPKTQPSLHVYYCCLPRSLPLPVSECVCPPIGEDHGIQNKSRNEKQKNNKKRNNKPQFLCYCAPRSPSAPFPSKPSAPLTHFILLIQSNNFSCFPSPLDNPITSLYRMYIAHTLSSAVGQEYYSDRVLFLSSIYYTLYCLDCIK